MNINWRAVAIGLIITVILVLIFSQFNLGYLGAIIGGLVVGYMITGSYMDGAINGGLSAGIGGFIMLPVYALLFERSIILIAIVAAIDILVSYFIIGAIFGIIGTFMKVKLFNKLQYQTKHRP